MVKALKILGYLIWRHMLLMIMVCICASVFLTGGTISLINSSILIAAFAACDFAKTKWIKVDVIQKEHLKKFGKFIWRHLLMIIGFFFTTYVLIEGHISWINTAYFFIGAIAVDWLKIKIKFSGNGSYDTHEQMTNYSKRENDWSYTGSSAWMSNPAMPGSPSNHLYNLGYNPGSTRY